MCCLSYTLLPCIMPRQGSVPHRLTKRRCLVSLRITCQPPVSLDSPFLSIYLHFPNHFCPFIFISLKIHLSNFCQGQKKNLSTTTSHALPMGNATDGSCPFLQQRKEAPCLIIHLFFTIIVVIIDLGLFDTTSIIKALFRSQNVKYKIFVIHLYGVLNVVKK